MGLFRHRHRVFSASLPTAQSYSPTTGAVGDTVTLTGTGFGAVRGAGAVTISGRSATIVSWSATSIVFKVPAQTSYPSNFGGVVVITDAGASSLAPGFFVTTGGAALFAKATSQVLSVADNPSLSMGDIDFTIAGWVKLTATGAVGVLLAQGNSGFTNTAYYVNVSAGGVLQFEVSNGSGTGVILSSTAGALATGTWYFFSAVHDSVNNVVRIGRNATENQTAYAAGSFDSALAIALGAQSGLNQNLDGALDGAAIWKRVLTNAELTTLYNAGVGLNYASAVALGGTLLNNLVAWWDLDDAGGSGATWIDRLGVSNLTAGTGAAAPTSVRGVR